MNTSDAYHEALNSHRHYDTMANATLSLIGAVIAGTPALYSSTVQIKGSQLVFLLSVLIIYICLQTYKRFDRYAGIALNVAAAIEAQDQRFAGKTIGFAVVFRDVRAFEDLDASGKTKTYQRIRLIAILISIAYASASIMLTIGHRLAA